MNKVEFTWGKYDAAWLPKAFLAEESQRGLPKEMQDPGSSYSISIHDKTEDSSNTLVGGANIVLGYDYLTIDLFWIRESHRRKSLGSSMLKELESFARKCAKRRILLSTFEFQNSLGFWRVCGFEEVGRVLDYPEGQRLIYLHKRII